MRFIEKHGFAISSPEYDYHYQYVLDQTSPGNGYWREFENLKQFVLRHAVADSLILCLGKRAFHDLLEQLFNIWRSK